jgi:hypothetical protein
MEPLISSFDRCLDVKHRNAETVEVALAGILDSSHRAITPLWSANRKRALSSALFRRVEVPLALK